MLFYYERRFFIRRSKITAIYVAILPVYFSFFKMNNAIQFAFAGAMLCHQFAKDLPVVS